MKTIRNYGLAVAVAAALSASLAAPTGLAQEFPEGAMENVTADDDSMYHSPALRPQPLSLAREKAVQRGQQRMARLEAMRWYGFSNSRPTAAAIPFTTMYSPAWQMPGGRPFAWYTSSRPIVIYASPVYR
jgi:hypothetical protein